MPYDIPPSKPEGVSKSVWRPLGIAEQQPDLDRPHSRMDSKESQNSSPRYLAVFPYVVINPEFPFKAPMSTNPKLYNIAAQATTTVAPQWSTSDSGDWGPQWCCLLSRTTPE